MHIETDLNRIPIVLAFTPAYFIPATVCVKSILENAKQDEIFHFICLLSKDLSDKRKVLLQDLVSEDVANFTFLDLEGKFAFPRDHRFTDAAYYRLVLPDLLPTLDKVIYIDSDTVVQSNIGHLYHSIKLDDYYLAGVPEIVLKFQKERLVKINCDVDNYMNSGFILINLAKMREDQMVPKFLKAARSNEYFFPDQDILNLFCANKIKWLAPYLNSINVFRVPAYKSLFVKKFSEREWLEANTYGTLHYTGTNKPWAAYTLDFEVWWRYYRMLPKPIKNETIKNRNFWKMHYLSLIVSSVVGPFMVTLIKKGRSLFKANPQISIRL